MQYALPTIPSLLLVHTRLSYIQRALFLIQRLQDNEIFVLLSPLLSSTYIQQNSLIQLAPDWTDAKLLNILDYQTVAAIEKAKDQDI